MNYANTWADAARKTRAYRWDIARASVEHYLNSIR